jgi:hypothetical protein
MARREVIELLCDRCKRVETIPKTAPVEDNPHFMIQFGDKRVEYTDICSKCLKSLTNYFNYCVMAKNDEEKTETAHAQPQTKPTILNRIAAMKSG